MANILPYYILVVNSVLIAKYYTGFLTPRSNRFPRAMFVIFGVIYLFLQYFTKQLLAGLPLHFAAFSNILIMLVITISLSFLFFKDDLGKQVFFLFSFFAVQEICLFISFSIFNLLGNTCTSILNSLLKYGVITSIESVQSFVNKFVVLQYYLQMLVYVGVGFFALQNTKKSFVYKNLSISLSELSYLILPCLSGLSVTFIIMSIVFKPEGNGFVMLFNDVPFADLLIPLAGFILLLSLIASIRLFQKLAESHIEQREKAVLHMQMQQLQEQMRDVDGIYTEIRGMRHDMKNHISNIRLLVTSIMEGDQSVKEELEEYLGKYESALSNFEFTYQTGNSISDIIIHQKYTEAVNNGIDFTSDFSYQTRLNLDAYDLAIILNNAIENAIEACNNVPQPYRFIHLYSYSKGEMFFIEVENSFDGSLIINEQTHLPTSRKASTEVHGMGLSNIQRCARKYFGDIDFQVKAAKSYNVFRLTAMLQGRS